MKKVILMILIVSSIFGATTMNFKENIIFNGNVDNKRFKLIYSKLNTFLSEKLNATPVVFKNDIKKIGKSLSVTVTSASGASQTIYLKKKNNYSLVYFKKDMISTVKHLLDFEKRNKSFNK